MTKENREKGFVLPRKNHDIITEEQFTVEGRGSSTDPQEDSPGDSEQDAGLEFLLGVNYQPFDADFVEEGEFATVTDAALEIPNDLSVKPVESKFRIPFTAMVTSSELPNPWEDLERESSRN